MPVRVRLMSERKRAPRPSDVLHTARYSKGTRRQYDDGVRHFLNWVRSTRARTRSSREMDAAFCEFLRWWFDTHDGRSAQTVVCAYYGLRWYIPELKNRMPRSLQLINGWKRHRPSEQHPPLTWPLACAIAIALVRRGLPRYAVGVLLSFDCLLRVHELAALRPVHVQDGNHRAHEHNMRGRVLLHLPKTKANEVQSVEVWRPEVRRLVLWLASVTPTRWTLLAARDYSFRYAFTKVVAELGLDPKFVLHSLRHGGATAMYNAGASMVAVRDRGRWSTVKSARHYVQSGRALSMENAAPEPVVAAGDIISRDLLGAFALALAQ